MPSLLLLKWPHTAACLGVIIVTASAASACSVPVFRYALEHWEPDQYQAVVAHRGELPEPHRAAMQKLAGSQANVTVRAVDLDKQPPEEIAKAWQQAGSPAMPWLIVQPPRSLRGRGWVWSAAFDEKSAGRLRSSPAREEIIRRLGDGESAVWLVLESGDKAKDHAAAELVEKRIEYLAGVMAMPKLAEQDIQNGLVSLPSDGLRLAFSTMRVSRQDEAEKFLVASLLATEEDLKDFNEPMVFPVFGQGRALYALVGKGVMAENIDEAAEFLIGKCSCQIKESNPGADLLLDADWQELVQSQNAGIPDLPEAKSVAELLPQTVKIEGAAAAGKSEQPAGLQGMPWLAVIGSALAAMLLLVFLRGWKSRAS